MIAFGYRVLRLPPDAFWAITPRELSAALGRPSEPMGRARLVALMKLHPDEEV